MLHYDEGGTKAHLNTMTYILYIIHNLFDRVYPDSGVLVGGLGSGISKIWIFWCTTQVSLANSVQKRCKLKI